jgi:hypothetical protein
VSFTLAWDGWVNTVMSLPLLRSFHYIGVADIAKPLSLSLIMALLPPSQHGKDIRKHDGCMPANHPYEVSSLPIVLCCGSAFCWEGKIIKPKALTWVDISSKHTC